MRRQNVQRNANLTVFIFIAALVLTMLPIRSRAASLTLEEAQARVDAAKAELEAVQKKRDKGACGFFEWVQSVYPEQTADAEKAIAALNAYEGVDPMIEGDATRLENMQKALELIEYGNGLRTTDDHFSGLAPFKVNHELMAIAMSNADLSGDPSNGHLGHFRVGENLAWGYSNPYIGWYTKEKEIYDAGGDGVVGHYLALVGDFNATGLGVSYRADGSYWSTYSQVFSWTNTSTLLTPQDYLNELNTYILSIDPEPYERALAEAEYVRDTLTPVTMYRLYYPDTHEHFYTANEYEMQVLTTERGWTYEGIGWYAPKAGNQPVYRLYNPYSTDHHYTMDRNEYDTLGRNGWEQEGIGWYSDPSQGKPLYRLFTKSLVIGSHHYTLDEYERSELLASGAWDDEEIGWYGMK